MTTRIERSMTTNKSAKQRSSQKPELQTEATPLIYPLRSLLHTVRCIAQHEDALCTVLHNLQSHPENTAALTTELHTLLDQIPARDYIDDLDALHQVLLPPTKSR